MARVLPPWPASMFMAASRQTHRDQEYGGKAMRRAVLDSRAVRLGCHRNRMYTTRKRCPANGELQRKAQPCIPKTDGRVKTNTCICVHIRLNLSSFIQNSMHVDKLQQREEHFRSAKSAIPSCHRLAPELGQSR